MHVREPAQVRDEMADQVVAGADILLAPTWLTHRRALVPVGETRRAQEWTTLAVSVARQASEMGRERRGEAREIAILGVLPDPAAIDEGATGRLLKPDAAAERDERTQAGILAETGLTGVIIEARPSLERTRVALRVVVEHEMAAWVTVPAERADGLPLAEWLDTLAADAATMLLFEALGGSPDDRPLEGRFGVVVPGPLDVPDARGAASRWIERGASVLGVAADATPDALRPLVDARDAAIAAASRTTETMRAELEAWIADAARRAAGGRALWIGAAPTRLPQGFDWSVVPSGEIARLPAAVWRLVISPGTLDPLDVARLVERGGIVAGTSGDPAALVHMARATGLRLDQITPIATGEWRYLGRRED